MKFKSPHLEVEYDGLHPEVKGVLEALDAWSADNGLPGVVITALFRTRSDMEAIYWRGIARRLALGTPGVPVGEVERSARKLARDKFSWHLCRCAADIRNFHYLPEQRRQVMAFLRERCPRPMFELVEHDVGKGDHIHVGRKDFGWRKQFPPKE